MSDKRVETLGYHGGHGIFINEQKTLCINTMEEDHLRIVAMKKGGDLTNAFKLAFEAENQIQRTMKYSWDDHLGYLTSLPTNLGTAMKASCRIQLSNVSDDQTFESYTKLFGYAQQHAMCGIRYQIVKENGNVDQSVIEIYTKHIIGKTEA